MVARPGLRLQLGSEILLGLLCIIEWFLAWVKWGCFCSLLFVVMVEVFSYPFFCSISNGVGSLLTEMMVCWDWVWINFGTAQINGDRVVWVRSVSKDRITSMAVVEDCNVNYLMLGSWVVSQWWWFESGGSPTPPWWLMEVSALLAGLDLVRFRLVDPLGLIRHNIFPLF